MPSITVRMPEALLQDLDERIVNSRYKNRSELIRDLARRYVEGTLIPTIPAERRR